MIPSKSQINQQVEEYLQAILEMIPDPKDYQIETVQCLLRLTYIRAWIKGQGDMAEESLKKVGMK